MVKSGSVFNYFFFLHRDAVNEDKRKELLKLDNTAIKLKTSSSDGRIRKSGTFVEDNNSYLDSLQSRAQSCHVPFATSLERIADCSIKGVSLDIQGIDSKMWSGCFRVVFTVNH